MSKQRNIVDRRGQASTINRQTGKYQKFDAPFSMNLLEKPHDAEKKQRANYDMPSDFWL